MAFKLIFLLFFVALTYFVKSQNIEWFSKVSYNQYFLSDMNSPNNRVELVKMNKLSSWYYKENAVRRPFIELNTGFNIPFVSFDRSFEYGKLHGAFDVPVKLNSLVDLFETTTAPEINNDYMFGLKMTFLFSPKKHKNSFIKNYHLTLVPVLHESSHLGDEFIIHGYNKFSDFARINVSYEAWQIVAGFNRLRVPNKRNLSAEFGYQRLMPYRIGYYNLNFIEINGQHITHSVKRDKLFARAEYIQPILKSERNMSEFVFSVETRRDIKYGFTINDKEKQVWGVNAYFGYRFSVKNTNKQIGLYYRHYRGVVPYGQLQKEDGFILNSLSMIIN